MDKKLSNFYFWGAGYLLLVCAILTLTSSKVTDGEIQILEREVAPLLCFNVETSELRTSDTESGCIVPEESLGTEPINHADVRPTQIDRTFEVRFLAAQVAAKEAGFNIRIT